MVEDHLSKQEAELLARVLRNWEAALIQDFSEYGRIDPTIVPPQITRTVLYKAQQSKSIPIPKPLVLKVIDLLRQRQQRGIIEESYSSYYNNWFLVKKKNRSLYLINDTQKANIVTLKDIFIPLAAKEFSKDFARYKVISLLDLFSGYN